MNNIEEIKLRRDGLDVLEDIHRYAAEGEYRIAPADEALFKWYGVYTQRPAEDGYFMVRIRIPGGQLNASQVTTNGSSAALSAASKHTNSSTAPTRDTAANSSRH